jgi:peptidoglycan/LPS O-acetylase OafA/YrhL
MVVFVCHFSYLNQSLEAVYYFAPYGVVLFFCLTGFLLGRICLREMELTGTLRIYSFLLRRLLRTLPLYILFLFLILILSLFSLYFGNGALAISKGEWIHLMTSSYNFVSLSGTKTSPLPAVTWSLSIEEQIYLIFPFLVYFFGRYRSATVSLFLISIIFSMLFVFVVPLNDVVIGRLTTTFLIPTTVGLFIAQIESQFRSVTFGLLRYFIFALLIASGLLFVALHNESDFDYLLNVIIVSLIFPLIYLILTKIRMSFLLVGLAKVGRISYGCYLYHWLYWNLLQMGSSLFSPTDGFSLFGVLFGFIMTLITASISYWFFEKRFLLIRQRYQIVSTF